MTTLQEIIDTWFIAQDISGKICGVGRYYIAFNIHGDRVGNTLTFTHRDDAVAELNQIRRDVGLD